MSKWTEYFLYVGGRRLGLSSLLSIVCSFTSLPYLCPSLDDVVQYLLRNLHSYLDIWLEVGSRADTEIHRLLTLTSVHPAFPHWLANTTLYSNIAWKYSTCFRLQITSDLQTAYFKGQARSCVIFIRLD